MTFLEKFELLKKSVPVPAVSIGPYTVGCEFVEYVYRSKNSYYCYDGYELEDSMYSSIAWGNKLVDCDSVTESEKCFECIDCTKCHSSTYIIDCNSCTDCHFSSFLNSCTDCFGCVSLTHKKYCIFNIQYTKEEYIKKVEELKREKPKKILEQMFDLKQTIPHPASQQANNQNCPYGDYVYNSKNCYWGFNIYYLENSGYCYITANVKNSWDILRSGGDPAQKTFAERNYQLVNSRLNYECAFLTFSDSCTNCYYCSDIMNCTDCFGCVGLKNKKYCILNNQLTKEQYEKAVKEIKSELGWK